MIGRGACEFRRHFLAVGLARRGLHDLAGEDAHQLVFAFEDPDPLVGVSSDHLVEHGAQGVGPEGLEAHLLGDHGRVSGAALEQRTEDGLGLRRRELAS